MRKLLGKDSLESNHHQIIGIRPEPHNVGGVGSRTAASHKVIGGEERNDRLCYLF